ncbi:MAG TPA: gamma-glutamyltransferase [Arenimonas sp.]|uniref:gamma-glutamyltransferase n=1 Tax=Arenimonas sp. TaxID=1872635 RepID=UPI002C1BD536|nr:gamma-glutamyltransferase [Arenimonas sp.]HMB56444.1 gamma-glutamyltransferase [Arenimonas sp.]
MNSQVRGRAGNIWLLLGLCLFTLPAFAKEPVKTPHPNGAAIASAHSLATEAGHEILAKGGNAFDAAVAVSSVLSVVEPVSSGLGGGAFYLLHDGKTGRDIMVDARETAPASATPAKYLDAKGELDRDKAENGPMSAGIPGLPAGLVHIAQKYGRLPLSVSLAPAIRIARNGFPIYPRLVDAYAERREVMERYDGTRKVYLADGDAPKTGETLRQPDLARTLEQLAARGFDGFYRGETAAKIVADVNKYGGDWKAADLASYRIKERTPITFKYRDWRIVTAPPPSSGGVALAEILQMLEGWDLAKLDEPHRIHILTEAMRRAYRDRTIYLGDPDFVKMPIAQLISDDYAAGLRAGILPDKATPSAMLPGDKAPLEGGHTTHFSIIDRDGNFVSATQTVNLYYGSGMVADGTGVLLNDEMDDFALRPGTPNAFGVMGFDANAVKPGKRMLSSMSPSFMIGKDRVAVLGTPGGSRIITMVLLGMLGIEQGLDPQQITALPRFHHQYLPDTIYLEPGALSPQTIAALKAMGHDITQGESTWGNMQAVDWDLHTNALRAGSDPRNPVGKGEVVPAH